MNTLILGLSLYLFTISTASAFQPDVIGHIQKLNGTASILRDNNTVELVKGAVVYRGDMIRTAKTGSVGIVMTDDSTLSLGPNSEIALKDYLFNPKEGKFAFVTRITKGTFGYLSGIIGKLSPDSIRLEIPDATIAVRGTKLLIEVKE